MAENPESSPVPATSVAVLAIDGANADLFDMWLDDGTLPNLRQMRDRGLSGTVTHTKKFRNERCWNLFLAGCDSGSTGSRFDPAAYRYTNETPGNDGLTPFYANNGDLRVCIFDLIAPLVPQLEGLQLIGWGSELNAFEPRSVPSELMAQMCERHGPDPKMETAYDVRGGDGESTERGFRNPSIYSADDLQRYIDYLRLAIERRTAIALDLISRGPWGLYLGLYPETHTANHLFWHLSQPYPVEAAAQLPLDPIRDVFRAIDTSIGTIAKHLPTDCAVLTMTIDETGPNRLDIPSMALLPEVLWRASGLGPPALFQQSGQGAPEPYSMDYDRHWKDEIWALRTPYGEEVLSSPDALTAMGDPLNWNPARWYGNLWPKMRAFALPNVSDGHIRLNVTGREASGLVRPEDFMREIEALCALVGRLVDARTGKPAVEECLVMRTEPHAAPHIPPDIVVVWAREATMDCMDHPQFGRVGPVPFFRSGGHRAHGSLIRNAYIASGGRLNPAFASAHDGELVDLPATILDIIGRPPHPGMTGKPLISFATRQG